MDFTIIIEKSKEGSFVGSVVELPGCYTQAQTLDGLIVNIKEAIKISLEDERTENLTEFVGIQKVSV